MKATIDIPENQVTSLNRVRRFKNVPLGQIIHQAIDEYLRHQPIDLDDNSRFSRKSIKEHPAFGMWKDRNVDALEYQRQLRAEWDN